MMSWQLSFYDKNALLRWWVLLLTVFVIHNVEEILFDIYGWELTHSLPIWMEAGRKLHAYINLTTSKFVLLVVAICVLVSGFAFLLRNRPRASRNWMAAFVVIMLAVYLGHLVTSIYARSPQPGVFSAVLQGIPVYGFALYRLWCLAPGEHG
jgi:hypothetical protein